LKNTLSIDPEFWKGNILLRKEIDALIYLQRKDLQKIKISGAAFYNAFSSL